MKNAPKNRQGWAVVAGTLLLMTAFMGIVNNCYALFIIPVTQSLHFSRSAYSLCQTLNYLCCMLSSALSWRLYRRFGLLRTVRAACILLCLAYFSYSRAFSLPVFYLISCVLGLCMGLTITAAVPMLIKGWFRENCSMAIGIAMMGSGLGGMVFNPLAQTLMASFSWRSAYAVLAAVMALTVLPAAFFLIRENREAPAAVSPAAAPAGSTPAGGRRSAVLALVFLHSLCCTTLFYTVTPYLQDIGYSARFASVCASVTMAVLAAGKVVEGILLDRISLRRCAFLALSFVFVGLAALSTLRSAVLLVPVLIGVFLGCPFCTVAPSAIAAALSTDPQQENAATSHLTAVVNLGAALSPMLAGLIFDAASSYLPLFIGTAAVMFLALFAVPKLFPES